MATRGEIMKCEIKGCVEHEKIIGMENLRRVK